MNEERLIAEVYPIQRLPRRFSVFDYLVPNGLSLQEGTMVRIPLRGRETCGVVKCTRTKRVPVERLKSVLSASPNIFLKPEELSWYEWIASQTVQSVPSVLSAAIPLPQKQQHPKKKDASSRDPLKIRASEAPLLKRLLEHVTAHRRAFIHAVDFIQMSAVVQGFLESRPNERVAVITPNIREARWLAAWLPNAVALLTGDESAARASACWQTLREGGTRVLVGTRRASLVIPWQTDTIFVLRSSHPNHKQDDQNPRFDVRDIVWELSQRTGAKLYFLDAAPRADDVERFGKAHVTLQHPITSRPTIIDLRGERGGSPHPFLSLSATEAISHALHDGAQVLCLYPRKGKARALRCLDCGREFPCSACGGRFTIYETTVRCHHCGQVDPRPLSCPTCAGTNLEEQGYGNRAIKQALQRLFPRRSVGIIERDLVEDLASDILLATPYYLESVYDPGQRPERLRLVVILDADASLYDQTFRSFEESLLRVEEMRGYSYRCQAPLLVQTHVPDLFRRFYDDPEHFYADELTWRRLYHQPPFARRMRLISKEKDTHRARIEGDATMATLAAIPGVQILSQRISRPVMHPTIDVAVDLDAVPSVCETLSALPDHVIIDTNVAI